jgi:ribonuclease HI
MADAVAQMFIDEGKKYFSRTAHMRMGHYRDNSKLWKKTSKYKKLRTDVNENTQANYNHYLYDTNRVCYSHEYIGVNYEKKVECDIKMIEIWTDGGCSGNGKETSIGGWGVVLKYGDYEKELYNGVKNTTNNRMELQACIEALQTLKTNIQPIIIYSDSQYVVDGINNWIFSWIKNNWKTSTKKEVENKDLWVKLLELKNNFNLIKFVKVKGHSDNEYNNRADKLAQKGIESVKIKEKEV